MLTSPTNLWNDEIAGWKRGKLKSSYFIYFLDFNNIESYSDKITIPRSIGASCHSMNIVKESELKLSIKSPLSLLMIKSPTTLGFFCFNSGQLFLTISFVPVHYWFRPRLTGSMCCGCNKQIHTDYRSPVEKKGWHGHSLSERGPQPLPGQAFIVFMSTLHWGWSSFLKKKFIVIQLQLSAFSPHPSTPPSRTHLPPLPPPSPLIFSMCPL